MSKKNKKEKVRTCALYIRGIPVNLKNYFRAHCIKREKTMSEVIMDFMKQVTSCDRQTDKEIKHKQERERDGFLED